MEKQKRKKKTSLWGAGAGILILVCVLAGVAAKYRSSHEQQALVQASEFHFTSDYLEEEGASYTITDWSDGFEITLYNYEKENTALVTADSITYSVELSGAGNWMVEGETSGTILGGTKQKQTIQILPKMMGAAAEDTVTVTVETSAPYRKSLSATFTMKGKQEPSYRIEDQNDGTVLLTIQTNSYKGPITVAWTDEFSPDNTNPKMETWLDTETKGILETEKNTTYSLLFFKNTTTTISETTGSGTNISLP